MDRTLLVSSTQKGLDYLGGLLRQIGRSADQLSTASDGGQARRLLLEQTFGLVVINTPLSDEFGRDLAVSAATTSASAVILIVKTDLVVELSHKLGDSGISVLGKPMTEQLFDQTVRMSLCFQQRLLEMQRQQDKLRRQMEDLKLVCKAKCLLVQTEKIDEPQAHRIIEKRAMDFRLTRREVALEIIEQYEL